MFFRVPVYFIYFFVDKRGLLETFKQVFRAFQNTVYFSGGKQEAAIERINIGAYSAFLFRKGVEPASRFEMFINIFKQSVFISERFK